MKAIFSIGEHSLEVSHLEVSFSEGQVAIHLTTLDHQLDCEKFTYLDGYNPNIRISLERLRLRYQSGELKQTWKFPEVEGFSLYAWGLGLDRFYGTLEIEQSSQSKGGRLRMQGEMADRYLDYELSPKVAIRLEAEFPAQPVDWTCYRFSSLQEAQQAPPEAVRLLDIDGQDCQALLPHLLEFPWLEELRLGQIFHKSNLTQLDEALLKLENLKGLYLFGAADLELPLSVASLSKLESLWIHDCPRVRLPEDLFLLPSLQRLSLRGAQLSQLPQLLPEHGSLQFLDLANNCLTRIADELIERFPLSSVDLHDNPFEYLPAALANVRRVEIETHKIKLYKDVTYPSKNPNPIEPSLFQLSPEQRNSLEQAIEQWPSLVPHKQAILSQARQAVYLTTFPEDAPLGGTRIGGWPDLPPTLEYPRDDENRLYIFFAQLNLAELSPHQAFLPRQGWLYFFAEEENQFSHPRILYFAGNLSSLQPFCPQPQDSFADIDRQAPYPACRVEICADWSLPNLYGCSHYGQARFGPDFANFLELEEQSYRHQPDPYEQLSFGRHPQQNTHVLNSYVFTQNESPEEQACQSLLGEAQEWCNLLTLSSDSNNGFCFWDAGTITFSVHKKDLAIGEFSRIHLSLESS